jgi:ubiquinone/menaquinone biosynthesis C-methylase UbiE
MREDWNARAREDAGYYVAFGRREQEEAEFFATASDLVRGLEIELKRFPPDQRTSLRGLEIGCGPARVLRPMSRNFKEIHGVDVSDEMIALARENLRGTPHAFVHATNGATLELFENDSFDFVYSYAVFQHIPSRDVVLQYMRETRRVLKPGGFARFQLNGLPMRGETPDTWAGSRFSSSEILEFAQQQDLQVLALEGVATQYMWTTLCKRPQSWHREQDDRQERGDPVEANVRIRRITNANSSEPVAPSRGRFASISIWTEFLPPEAGLAHLRVLVGEYPGTVTYIGPPDNLGLQQLNVILPELEATGLLPVEIHWLGQRVSPPATLRVIPPGPTVPRIFSITDGVNLLSGTRIETRTVKLTLEEIARPHELEAWIDNRQVHDLEYFCIDPRPQRFEMNFRLPEDVGPGRHRLELRVGRRRLAPVELDVVDA